MASLEEYLSTYTKKMVELFEKTANAYKVFNFNKWYNELKNKYLKATDYLEEYIKVKKMVNRSFYKFSVHPHNHEWC